MTAAPVPINGDTGNVRLVYVWLDGRTYLSDTGGLRGAEFERRVQKLARRKGVACEFVADKGKGSHGRLDFGAELPLSRIGRRKSAVTYWRRCAETSVSIRMTCEEHSCQRLRILGDS